MDKARSSKAKKGGQQQQQQQKRCRGSCGTCRRRHVRCDQTRPACVTCRTAGVDCEGYSADIRWAINGVGLEAGAQNQQRSRRHLYTEEARQSMSAGLTAELVPSAVDARLAEIDAQTRDYGSGQGVAPTAGPFAVLDFGAGRADVDVDADVDADAHVHEEEHDACHGQEQTPVPAAAAAAATGDYHTATPPPSSSAATAINPFDELLGLENSLQWDDLFDANMFDASTMAAYDNDNNDQMFWSGVTDTSPQSTEWMPDSGSHHHHHQQQLISPTNTTTAATDNRAHHGPQLVSTEDAQFLLGSFGRNLASITTCAGKSPWETLNLAAAVQTLAETTFLGGSSGAPVSHARKANYYGVLSCSAYHLLSRPAAAADDDEGRSRAPPPLHLEDLAARTLARATHHMQRSLKTELAAGPGKARYKDQLMAILMLTMRSVMSGNYKDARIYMLDAERLLRLRGLAKRCISRRSRLLHHVYTWMRIVGESTYVIHDYYGASSSSSQAASGPPRAHHPHRGAGGAGLDDFLVGPRPDDNSDLAIEQPKERDAGRRDIHLEDSRQSADTLMPRIYGVPETWLSLVSQVTRLANLLAASDAVASASSSSLLQRRAALLEDMVCTFAARVPPPPADDAADDADRHRLRALNAGLEIFFYRRVRDLHPRILQGHVRLVMDSLARAGGGAGTGWAGFVAGCEATAAADRRFFDDWAAARHAATGGDGFRLVREVMGRVWRGREGAASGTRHCSWIDVSRELNLWVALC